MLLDVNKDVILNLKQCGCESGNFKHCYTLETLLHSRDVNERWRRLLNFLLNLILLVIILKPTPPLPDPRILPDVKNG